MHHNYFSIPTTGKQVWHQYRCYQWNKQIGLRFLQPEGCFPRFVNQCPLTMRTIPWLRLIDWEALPLTPKKRWFGRAPFP